uniref:hypothetical protein n=1 Tax=Xanthomonas floridensis TaxID=1843580 RepID=UPI0013796E6F|nr:hypothetical protein [Xanthomonas floridensis]
MLAALTQLMVMRLRRLAKAHARHRPCQTHALHLEGLSGAADQAKVGDKAAAFGDRPFFDSVDQDQGALPATNPQTSEDSKISSAQACQMLPMAEAAVDRLRHFDGCG